IASRSSPDGGEAAVLGIYCAIGIWASRFRSCAKLLLALSGNRHRLRLARRWRRLASVPAPLPPDEEQTRGGDRECRDVDVQPDARDLVRGVDPKRLDPDATEAVEKDVE